MKKDLTVLLVGSLLLGGCSLLTKKPDVDIRPAPVEESQGLPTKENIGNTQLTLYQLEAILDDVTGGDASGSVQAGFIENEYRMVAGFENLPPLKEGYLYEGWVVRDNPKSVVSTGALEDQGVGVFANIFRDERDLTDHLKYVLTLEPDDGDPAPAEHVLEGLFGAL